MKRLRRPSPPGLAVTESWQHSEGFLARTAMGLPAFFFVLTGLFSVAGTSVAAERRSLPIRGERLLQEMRSTPLPPLFQESFVSPTGGTLLYTEATYRPPYGVGYSDRLSADPDWKLWLQNIETGTRVALPMVEGGRTMDDFDAFRIGRRLAPPWSADGKAVALLEQREGDLSVWVFTIDGSRAAAPVRIPALGPPGQTKESVTDWYWDSQRGEILLGLEVGSSGYQPYPPAKQEPAGWTWILSRDQVPADGKRDAVAARNNRVVAVHLQSGRTEQVYPNATNAGTTVRLERETGRDPWTPGLLNWQFGKGGSVLLRLRDPAVARIDDAKLRWQLQTGDPQAARFRDARSRVYALDRAGKGAVVPLLSTGVGRIASITPDADESSYATVQGTAGTSNWPMDGSWGELSWKAVGDTQENPPVAIVSSDSWMFASDRPGVVYQYDPLLLKLAEISRSKARPVDLGLPGFSITHCDVSADGRTIAAVFESADMPPEIHVWNSGTRRWRSVAAPAVKWRNPSGITVEQVVWRSRDDVFDVDGFVIKPPGFDTRKRYPMLVLMAGGNALRTSRFTNRFDPMYGGGRAVGGPPGAIYAAAGYLVFLANHRGTEGAGVAANRAFIGRYGRHLELDVFAGIDMLVAKGWADPERLGVIGHSHGGDEAYYSISHSRRFKAALINDSSILMPELFVPYHEGNADVLRTWYGADIMQRMIGADPVRKPWADPDAIRTPLLLRWAARHGPNALERIDLGQGWDKQGMKSTTTYALIHALKRNGVPIEVLIDQDEHQVENPRYMIEWQSRLLQWFDFFVQGKGADPIPAMSGPFDYEDDLREIGAKADKEGR
jgi:dipeptidyl aminopeptidase/acylaminoacyl peptidase